MRFFPFAFTGKERDEETGYGYSNMGGVTHFLEETSDPEGRISYTYTDARGLTTNHIDALHGVTRFEYDALGQLRRTYDPDNFMTAYGYDNLGHLILRVHPDAGATHYAYDPAGNLIAEENPLGQIFYDYTYYRLAGKRYGNMSGNDVIYEYGTEGTATGLPVRINDGSGSLTLEYDAMGNVSKSVRVTSVPTSGIAFAFTHSFLYDSWGRMLQMTYPDGERVHYEYNRAGDLLRMYGEKNNHSRIYIDDIGYNKYGQRTYVDYGNGARTEYSYDPLRRLDRLRSRDAHNRILQEIGYSYDRVSNITQTRNTASVIDGMGGAFENNYVYDGLDRLVHASGDSREGHAVDYKLDEMRYSASGRVGSKIQWWSTEAGHGAQHLEYGYVASGEKPHAPRLIADHATDSRYGLQWDPAGNLIQVIAHGDAPAFAARFHYWTEDNRLHTVADDRSYSYYAYDHTGQRVLKLTGASDQLDINADFLRTHTVLTEPTLYPSPYIVLSNHGYTKHYYAGSERVAARIGGGNLDHDTACIVADEEATERADRLLDWCLRQVKETAIAPLDLSSLDIRTIDGDRMDAPWWLDEAPTGLEAGLKLNVWKLLHAMDLLSSPSTVPPDTDDEPDVYFYHSDHLGSASWITEAGGKPVQHIQYLPYGEPYVNQRVGGYNERFTFTGKERDDETGYSYFGARYMDHELMTMWLSVDPLADKYPSISPYVYCAWNPIKLIDPDGRQVRPTPRYATFNRLQRYARSNIQRTTYRPSSQTATRYSRTGCPTLSHAPIPSILRQQKQHGIISQFTELYGKRWIEHAARLINSEMTYIDMVLKNNQYSIVETEQRIYTDRGSSVSIAKSIQFDSPEAQARFDQAQATWTAAYDNIQKNHSTTLPNGQKTLDYDGWNAVLELGKSPLERVLDQSRKSGTNLNVVDKTSRTIPSIQTSAD